MTARPETSFKAGTEGLPRRLAREVKVHTAASRALRTARRATRGPTVVVGPWSSEVGFELLYWIPFVRRRLAERGVSPDHVVVVSRGGVSGWYEDLSSHYLDLFDWLPEKQLMEERLNRIETSGGEKQMSITDFDRAALAEARERIGDPEARVLHPMTMYRRYRAVWMRRRAPGVVTREVDFSPISTTATPPSSPARGEYIAVKAYFSSCFPDTAENRDFLRTLVLRLTRHAPVVLLGSAGKTDDHEHPELSGIDLGAPIPGPWPPNTNLAEQTQIVAGARMLIATYGGFSYIGPFLGVPTCAFYSNQGFNPVHLEVLRAAERALAGDSDAVPPGYIPLDTRHLALIDQIAAAQPDARLLS